MCIYIFVYINMNMCNVFLLCICMWIIDATYEKYEKQIKYKRTKNTYNYAPNAKKILKF